MYVIGGADWVTGQAENRMWVYDPILQVRPNFGPVTNESHSGPTFQRQSLKLAPNACFAMPHPLRALPPVMLTRDSHPAPRCWTWLAGRCWHAAQVYTLKALMPERRTRFAAAVFNNEIWVIGGYDNVAGTGEAFERCAVARSVHGFEVDLPLQTRARVGIRKHGMPCIT